MILFDGVPIRRGPYSTGSRSDHSRLSSVTDQKPQAVGEGQALEERPVRIVDEAHAANVRTSGARRGGALPDFLQLQAEPSKSEVVESLMAASSHKAEPVDRVEPPSVTSKRGPAQEVLEELLPARNGNRDQGKQQTVSSPRQSAEPDTPDRCQVPAARDPSVINELLEAGKRDDQDGRCGPDAATTPDKKSGPKP